MCINHHILVIIIILQPVLLLEIEQINLYSNYVLILVEVWTEKDGGNAYTTQEYVYGENIAKPLLYKKGPLAVMMSACYEMFYTTDGIFNYDCSLSSRRYLLQWVMIVSYGTNWFGTVLPKVYSVTKTYKVDYPTVLK